MGHSTPDDNADEQDSRSRKSNQIRIQELVKREIAEEFDELMSEQGYLFLTKIAMLVLCTLACLNHLPIIFLERNVNKINSLRFEFLIGCINANWPPRISNPTLCSE